MAKKKAKKQTPANRTKAGRFKKGVSGNPDGRPKQLREFRVTCREMSGEILATLAGIVRDPTERSADRIKAGSIVLAYGYGNPSQPIEFAKDDDGNAGKMEIVFNVDGKAKTIYTATVQDEGDK